MMCLTSGNFGNSDAHTCVSSEGTAFGNVATISGFTTSASFFLCCFELMCSHTVSHVPTEQQTSHE